MAPDIVVTAPIIECEEGERLRRGRCVPAQQAVPQSPDPETAEERRERLVRLERERVERNAYCGNLQWQAAKKSALAATGAVILTGAIDGTLTLKGASKGFLTRGGLIVGALTIFRDWVTGDQGDERCRY